MTSISRKVPLRVAAYIRENGGEGTSLAKQRKDIECMAVLEGWRLVEVYIEERSSGDLESFVEHPVLDAMLDDAAEDRFDMLVSHTLDRLSRNMGTVMNVFHKIAEHNVSYRAVAEDIDHSSPEGFLIMSILGNFARYFEAYPKYAE